jgi:hypothetical protein
VSGRSHDRSFIHYTEQSEMLISRHTNRKKYTRRNPLSCAALKPSERLSGIQGGDWLGIPPTGLAKTGFSHIKTDAGIPFQTRGGIPPEALPAKASG